MPEFSLIYGERVKVLHMTGIPTESRIFADRYLRELRRLEALHAGRISPGTKRWQAALQALYDRTIGLRRSPKKQAAAVGSLAGYLKSVRDDYSYLIISSFCASRAAGICFVSFEGHGHPALGVEEEGVVVASHTLMCNRHGDANMASGDILGCVSRHALARMHQRETTCELDADQVGSALTMVGVLGLVAGRSPQHVDKGLALRLGSTLLVGTLKCATKDSHDTSSAPVSSVFLDIRTALPADEVRDLSLLEQGSETYRSIAKWFDDPTTDPLVLAEQIPFLPPREDYVSKIAK
jgi:hypothetical protein